MLVIPAIDVKGGRCVRLTQGDPSRETVYGDDPVAVARSFADAGAKRLHVVDLDAALGTGSNLEIILKIRKAVGCPVEAGGGFRSGAAVTRALSEGVDRVIIGTALFRDPAWVAEAVSRWGERVMAGVDAKNGEVRVAGWQDGSGAKVAAAMEQVKRLGFREVIFTDISRDGMLEGPNWASLESVLTSGLKVVASGGVSSVDDIRRLRLYEPHGVVACIVGKALYENKMTIADALAAA